MDDPIKAREIERQRLANERRCRLLGIPNAQELWESWDRLAAESRPPLQERPSARRR